MNFTWEGHTDTDGNWGLLPIQIQEGSNQSGKGGPRGGGHGERGPRGGSEEGFVWGGVMGSIVNGDYMMSTVTWIWVYERYGLVDFVSTSWQNTLLALTPKPLVRKMALKIRPVHAMHSLSLYFCNSNPIIDIYNEKC